MLVPARAEASFAASTVPSPIPREGVLMILNNATSSSVFRIVLAYASTVLGTFLNRSGIVQGVHAFAGGPVGPVFLGFLAFLLLAGTLLAAWRAPHLRDDNDPPAALSREGAFLAGNWLFVVFAVMVLVGTLFPTIVEAVQGRRDASVGPAFYNAFEIGRAHV